MINGSLIGMGRMGITHLSILNSNQDVNIVAVCDTSKTMLNMINKYLKIKTYTNYKKMFSENELDFVIISTPPDSHFSLITAAIDKNINIFVEKPFTMSSTEGTEILNKMSGKALVNQVGYVNRFNEIFEKLKSILEDKLIGDIKAFKSEMYGATVLKDSKGSWRSNKLKGGGCLYEFAAHCIDIVVFLFGKPENVYGSNLGQVYSSDVDDIVSTKFHYKEGFTGSLFVNWCDSSFRKPSNIITVFGTKGKIIADKYELKVFMKESNGTSGFHEGWNTIYITDLAKGVRFYLRGNDFTRQLDYFIKNISNSVYENISDFKQANITDQLIELIRNDSIER